MAFRGIDGRRYLANLNWFVVCVEEIRCSEIQLSFAAIVKFGEDDGYIYLLFEHKSFSAAEIHLQLLEYMLSIWRLDLRQRKASEEHKGKRLRLPVILPLVLHHGPERWTVTRAFADLFAGGNEQFRRYIPDFEYLLYDLTGMADADIRGTVAARVVMLLFKHQYDADFLTRLADILRLLNMLPDQELRTQWVLLILRYIVSVIPDISEHIVTDVTEQALGGDIVMTIAEKWKEEGRQEGEQHGYERGLFAAIELGLRVKFGDDAVDAIMPVVQTVHDVTRLETIKESILRVRDLTELQRMIVNSQ